MNIKPIYPAGRNNRISGISARDFTSKGFYRHRQIDHFLCVKDFLFLEQEEKRYLLLRFFNASDFIADSMQFVLTQLDSAGTVLERTPVRLSARFAPGQTYAAQHGLAVRDECTDFRVEFTRVTSGDYTYTVSGDQVQVTYDRLVAPFVPSTLQRFPVSRFSVTPTGMPTLRRACLWGIGLMAATLLLSLYRISLL